jgi:Protein of unknown function (DUF3995)
MATGVAVILGVLALLHTYWGIVGVSGRSIALPEIDGKPTFMPSRLACFSVASALALAALLVLWRGGLVSAPVSMAVTTVGTIGVGVVFVLRAIGDFRLVGFFKRVRGTPFATWDTRLFSPLSLALGLSSLWVALS